VAATKTTYSAHGKFLLTGEYAALAGVPALAVPLRLKQHLTVTQREDKVINWQSHDVDGSLWFKCSFTTSLLILVNDDAVTAKLKHILKTALHLSGKGILVHGYDVVTTLDFNRTYGMGTSSTLIAMVSQWFGCDGYALQFTCFGGSGYDIACAMAQTPIIYTYDPVKPVVENVIFNPMFSNELFFVYLNRKQNSRESIARFNSDLLAPAIKETLSTMPQQVLRAANNIKAFKDLMINHEAIISQLIGLEPVQKYFADFPGVLKSLGGWGGDFILAVGSDAPAYFKARGYDVVLGWDTIVLS
jgi:mevalonate kinase